MTKHDAALRDFVYLDWERVRSLAAQLFRGVPQDVTAETGGEITAEGHLEGSIPTLIKAQGGVDYRYFRTANETRSFHHYVYSLVEDRLFKDGSVTSIDANFDFKQWTTSFFHDGQFVRVTGLVRLMDYPWVSTMLEALPKMLRTAHYAAGLHLKQMREAQRITQEQFEERKKEQQKEQQKQLNELNALKIDEITGLMRQLYGDVVRVKVLPNKYHPDKIFVGSGSLANFHDTAASLSQKYGYEIDAGWVTLGQINLSVVPDKPLPIPIGNAMEDAFEQVALVVNDLIRTASSLSERACAHIRNTVKWPHDQKIHDR
jgi:hypothetical protein